MDAQKGDFPFQRVVVIGTTGSGKSTLGHALAAKLGVPFIELDALHWEPGWQSAPDFRDKVDRATSASAWVVAGNYSKVRDLIWARAEVIIWLDYRISIVFWQLTRRTFLRWWRQELLWGTNRENICTHLKIWSEDSLFHWLLKTYWRRKRETPQLLARPDYSHLRLFHFQSPRETQNWLAEFPGQ